MLTCSCGQWEHREGYTPPTSTLTALQNLADAGRDHLADVVRAL